MFDPSNIFKRFKKNVCRESVLVMLADGSRIWCHSDQIGISYTHQESRSKENQVLRCYLVQNKLSIIQQRLKFRQSHHLQNYYLYEILKAAVSYSGIQFQYHQLHTYTATWLNMVVHSTNLVNMVQAWFPLPILLKFKTLIYLCNTILL